MNKEVISDKQSIALIALFIVGGSLVFAQGLEAKRDIWLAFILGIVMVLPMVIIYARLHYIFPNKDLFDILQICLGKFLGKVMLIFYIWFVFFIAGDIFVTYGQFIREVGLVETPQIIIIIFLGILCIWGIKKGIEVLGRFSEFFVITLIALLFIIILLLLPNMNIDNIRPVLFEGIKPVLEGAFSVFTFPLIQIVVFTMAFSSFKRKESSYKVYIIGLLVGSLFLAILSITNILVLGVNTATRVYYPSYASMTRIDVGNIIQRIEIVITISFILGGFIKISLLLLCACKGVTKLFRFRDYYFIITPISLLAINLSYFQYDSVMDYFEFNREIWPYYHFPFQVILPVIIWITAEIKNKRLANSTNS